MDRTVVALSIQMSHIPESSCYINTVQRRTKSIEIAFDNLEAAQSVKRLLAADTDRDIEHLRASQSVYDIDVSQPNDDRMDDSDMPDPIMADIEHLREPVPPADALIPKDQSNKYPSISQSEKGIDISQLQINGVSISNCFLEGPEHLIATASQANALLPLETPLELSNLRQLGAIDAQHPELLDRRENHAEVTNGPLSTLQMASVCPGIPVHLVVEKFYQSGEQLEDASEAGLRNSAQWRNGKRLIERAPEFENFPKEPDNQKSILEEQRRKVGDSFPPQDEDHNSLYDASPKTPQGEPQPAEHSVEQISTNVNQKNLARESPKSNQRSKPGKSLSKKLTKRMRNDDGEVATKTPTKNATKPQTLKKPSSKGKNADVGNGNTGGHVQSKRRQGKQQTKTSKSTTDDNHTVEAFDEFEIPDSPPRPKGHRKPVSKASPTTQNTTKTHTQTEKRDVPSKFAMLSTSSSSSTRREQPENTRKAQLNHKAKSADAVNWDEDLNVDETEIEVSSRPGKRKAAKSMRASVAKGKSPKVAQANSAKKRAVTGKASTAPLTKPRTRRAAALTANKKIQGIAESDAREKEEALGVQSSKPNGRISMAQDKKHLKTSHSPGDHGNSGSVAQKIASIVTPEISLNNQQRHNQSKSPSQPQAQAEPLAPKTDPKTSPSDEIVLVDHSETFQNAVETKQGTLQRDELGTTSYVLNGEPTDEKDVPVLAMDEDIDTGDLGFFTMDDSHFQDAMAFSTGNTFHGSKSPKSEGNGPNLAIDYTIKGTQASELSHVRIHDQSLENTDMIIKTSISNSREPWASKLIGALKTVPRVLEVKTPQSPEKIAKQTPTQHVSYNIAKAGESRLTSKAVQSGGRTRGVSPTSLPHRVGYQKRDEEPTRETIVDGTEAQEHGHQYHGQIPTSAQVPATDAAYASPAVSPALKPSMTQPLEVVQVSSGVEDSSDESVVDDPDVRNDTTIDPIQTAAWAAQDGLDMSRAADTMPQVLATKVVEEVAASESVTKVRSKQRKRRGAEIVRPSSSKAITNASPKTSSGGIGTYGRTPDPKRKSNLISFSAKGPRNQGVASSQRPETLISNEHQAPHAVYPKKRQVYKLEHGNNDIGEVPPEDRSPIETRTIAPAGDHRAQGTAPRHGERRVGKLTSKLRKAMPSTTRDDVAITSPHGEAALSKGLNIDDNALVAEIPNTVPVAAAPTLAAQPFVSVADMGSNSGAKSRRRENKVSTSTLTAVPVRLPNTASVGLDRRPSLLTPRLIDAAPRENKRQADEFGVKELNEIALGKRRKSSSKVPVAEMIVPELVSKRSRSIEQNLSQRTGSQSVRVNEKGSPLPFARENDIAGSQPRLTQDIVRLPAKARLNRAERNEPTLPFDEIELDETKITFRQVSRAPHSKKWPLGSSGNSKLQPSSPNASSSIVDEMEPHHIHPSGQFINVETENVITAHEPPDPFVGAAKGQSNTFIDALRRTNYRPHELPVKDPRMSTVGVHKASRVVTYDEDLDGGDRDLNEGDEDVTEGDQDLEKTLVEPDAPEEHSETASQTSSTSQSFHSEDKSPSRNRSDSAHAKGDDKWQGALQPHQHDTLDVLYDVSRVSFPSRFPYAITNADPNPSTSYATLSPKKPQSKISSTTTNVAVSVFSVNSRMPVKKNSISIRVEIVNRRGSWRRYTKGLRKRW
jgi:hypothetical protein